MAPNRPCDVGIVQESALQIDYQHFFNDIAKHRQPSLVREPNKLHSQNKKSVISLAGGLPSPETFPFVDITVNLRDGSQVVLEGTDLNDALQYLPSQGYPPLLDFIRQLQFKMHNPPMWAECDVLVTPGSQDGLAKAIEMSLEKGESIIVQHPVFFGIESVINPYQADIIAIAQDKDGMLPEILRKELQKRVTPYDAFTKTKGIPKILYVNTTGSNPTGTNLSVERKREVYRIACEYNLIIMEDDPYYYLNFLEEYPESFLSMDTEGRVLRFDSFSKIISPGIRVGFITGPKPLLQKIERHLESSSLQAPSLSQVLLHKTLTKWGMAGLFDRFNTLQSFYRVRRDVMVAASDKYLSKYAEWFTPTAGMFLWIRVKVLEDVRHLVTVECVKRGVMFVTGHAYIVTKNTPCQYLRACFSLSTIKEIEDGIAILAGAIQAELEMQKSQGLNKSSRT